MANRGFVEMDAIVGIILLMIIISTAVSALIFSTQGLNEKIQGAKHLQNALIGNSNYCFARIVLENHKLIKRCQNDIFN